MKSSSPWLFNLLLAATTPLVAQAKRTPPPIPSNVSSTAPARDCVAVIDSGIDYTHPAFKGALFTNPGETEESLKNGIDLDGNEYPGDLHGWDFSENSPYPFDQDRPVLENPYVRKLMWDRKDEPTPEEEWAIEQFVWSDPFLQMLVPNFQAGHGTHVSGIAKRSSDVPCILPIRTAVEWDQVTEAIEYVADLGVRVVNMSFGWDMKAGNADRPGARRMALAMKEHSELLFVTVSQNQGRDLVAEQADLYPADVDIPNKIVVGAVDDSGNLADFSNIGEGMVDVYAPGVQISSTCVGGGECKYDGTSMAAPFVAGFSVKVLRRFPELGSAELKQRVLSYSHKHELVYKKGKPKEKKFNAQVLLNDDIR